MATYTTTPQDDSNLDVTLTDSDTVVLDIAVASVSANVTNETIDDRVNDLLTAGSNITLTYDDVLNTLTIAATEDNLANNTTDDLAEGTTNLYHTEARVNSLFDTRLATKSTSDLAEGTNLYYTTARANTDFDTRLSIKTTDDLSEGTTNLYYADSLVDAHLTGGTGVTYTTGTISIGQDVGTDQDVTFNTVTADLYGAIHLNVKNDEGAAISQGDPVYFKGVSGNNITVGIADADDPTKMPAFGVAATDANNNASLDIITSGKLSGINTSAYAVNDELYVSTTGGLTTTRPTGADDAIQKIARVERVHANNGSIYVMGAGRSNDIPNLATGHVFIGNGSGYEKRALTEADISDLQTYLTAETNDLSSVVTWANVPDANITESSVTQHEAALTITESQISDLDKENIVLGTDNWWSLESDWSFSGFDLGATAKIRPASFSNIGSTLFTSFQFGTNGEYNMATIGASGSADDGTHSARLLVHGTDNIIRSVTAGSTTTRDDLEIESVDFEVDATGNMTLGGGDIDINSSGLGVKIETDDSGTAVTNGLHIRTAGTPDNGDRTRMMMGWQDGETTLYGGAIQTYYDDGDDWQFIFSAVDPANPTQSNNLRIRKNFVSADKAFRMTAYDQDGVDNLPQTQAGIIAYNTDVSRLQVNNATSYDSLAILQDTRNINLEEGGFLQINSDHDFNHPVYGNLALDANVKMRTSDLQTTLSQDYFSMMQFYTENEYVFASLGASEASSSDNGSHSGMLMLHGDSDNLIVSTGITSVSGRNPLEIDATKLTTPKLEASVSNDSHRFVEKRAADAGDSLPLIVVRKNTSGGSTIDDDTKVNIAFQIADEDSDVDNATSVGGMAAVYDSSNGNTFRLYVDANDGVSESHEMEINEDFFKISRPMEFASYITSSVPTASEHTGRVIRVSDGDAGSPCLAMSDGTNWKVLATLGSTISSS